MGLVNLSGLNVSTEVGMEPMEGLPSASHAALDLSITQHITLLKEGGLTEGMKALCKVRKMEICGDSCELIVNVYNKYPFKVQVDNAPLLNGNSLNQAVLQRCLPEGEELCCKVIRIDNLSNKKVVGEVSLHPKDINGDQVTKGDRLLAMVSEYSDKINLDLGIPGVRVVVDDNNTESFSEGTNSKLEVGQYVWCKVNRVTFEESVKVAEVTLCPIIVSCRNLKGRVTPERLNPGTVVLARVSKICEEGLAVTMGLRWTKFYGFVASAHLKPDTSPADYRVGQTLSLIVLSRQPMTNLVFFACHILNNSLLSFPQSSGDDPASKERRLECLTELLKRSAPLEKLPLGAKVDVTVLRSSGRSKLLVQVTSGPCTGSKGTLVCLHRHLDTFYKGQNLSANYLYRNPNSNFLHLVVGPSIKEYRQGDRQSLLEEFNCMIVEVNNHFSMGFVKGGPGKGLLVHILNPPWTQLRAFSTHTIRLASRKEDKYVIGTIKNEESNNVQVKVKKGMSDAKGTYDVDEKVFLSCSEGDDSSEDEVQSCVIELEDDEVEIKEELEGGDDFNSNDETEIKEEPEDLNDQIEIKEEPENLKEEDFNDESLTSWNRKRKNSSSFNNSNENKREINRLNSGPASHLNGVSMGVDIKKRKLEELSKLSLEEAGGFLWDATPDDLTKVISKAPPAETVKEESDDDDYEGVGLCEDKGESSSKRDLELREKGVDEEEEPRSATQFDRLLLSSPDDSALWVKYMAFHLEATEIGKAREVAKRALKSIDIRKEDERLNIWMALLNLENLYSSQDVFKECLAEALKGNDEYKIYTRVLDIYVESGKQVELEQLANTMARKFRQSEACWVACMKALMGAGMVDKARHYLQRALAALPKRDHVTLLTKFALMEGRAGHAEEAQALFENILTSYPARVDVWSVYVDMLVKSNSFDLVRQVLERATAQKIPARKMKTLYKKWLDFEESHGDEVSVKKVKDSAQEYVERAMNSMES